MGPKEEALAKLDEIIKLVDDSMQGWLDADIMSLLESLKEKIKNI